MSDNATLKPGSTIGILGGGQLGRMLAIEAAYLGYRVITYAPEAHSVAAQVSNDVFQNKWNDSAAMAAFAAQCDVVTWEFENVPVEPLAPLESLLAPHPRALETAQDRLAEKRFVEQLGGRTAPYASVETTADLDAAIDRIGAPGILKTRRDGYDGKGQWRIESRHDADGIALPGTPCIYEGLVTFEAEFSVILVRGQNGEIRFWDSAENTHEGGILTRSTLPPCKAVADQVEAARELARQVADALEYTGVLTAEFFATADGPVFNEIAPRVHNSGHWTIEGAVTSQFANHIRAICGLPLGDTTTTAPQIEMENIIGKAAGTATDLLAESGAHLHLYGKTKARKGRKMGHVTRIGHDPVAPAE
ncbi:5-(carboxyamino)imidazole ribonucleotide synthase [Alteripontixanthobacter maritimus]|uniref:N5-carboxyaminoimidazole ribonucleotide synthase n=1 Tax=Alteripontixanthobacter maritimus TaxID=2161824 RepID=A0A369QCW3_9SPHN|nr:5-(carboxyamino)imidazole ribonucleotide synthase [Alteripontixanthobacter maritimus]RDC61076.1 5-(carboxyamino)imidazole ribonucleotide synthase [Alteripontixanthobacter maritimus]